MALIEQPVWIPRQKHRQRKNHLYLYEIWFWLQRQDYATENLSALTARFAALPLAPASKGVVESSDSLMHWAQNPYCSLGSLRGQRHFYREIGWIRQQKFRAITRTGCPGKL